VLVLANAHAPPPVPPLWSQSPVRPQAVVPAAHSLSGSVFAETAAQLPSATPVLVITQASQVPWQALLQQTPSAQDNPLVHWLVVEQATPLARLVAQVLVEVSQNDPVAQFASIVQAVGRQLVASMHATPPGQAAVVGAPRTQFPAPSQVPTLVVSWLPEQEVLFGQLVVALATAHAPFPSQNPVAPQAVVPAVQSLSGFVPCVIGAQVPLEPPVLVPMQDWQSPVQSLSQQTWSTLEQTPLAHCAVVEQVMPGDSFALQIPEATSHMNPLPQL
jgi:hypothetical protein